MTPPPMLVAQHAAANGFSVKDISGTWQQFMGIPMADQAEMLRGIADYGKAPADEAWVYRCITLKMFFAQGVPLRVYVRKGREKVPAEDAGDAAAEDMQFLLDDVNPVSMNGGDLKAYSIAGLSAWGENYVKKVRGRLGGRPQELWWVRAPDIDPRKGRSWIDEYVYRPQGGEAESIAPADIIPWRRPNLQDPTRGLSPLSSIRYDIAFGRNAAERRSQELVNWNVPPGAWVIPKDANFTEQDKTLVQRVLSRLRGPKGAGKTPIMPAGMTWQAIALNSVDAENIAKGKVSRMQVCAALGVPLVLAGDDEKTSVYRQIVDAERVFARWMISELDYFADGFQAWLVPEFDPTKRRLIVAFDYSQIEALQAPLEDRKRVALQEIEHGARTPDEYRAEFRIGQPLPDNQGAIVLQLQNLVPIGTGPEPAPTDTTAPADDMPDETPPDDPSNAVRSAFRSAAKVYQQTGDLALVADALGVDASDALRLGLQRRYSAKQLLNGVPAENYAPLRAAVATEVAP